MGLRDAPIEIWTEIALLVAANEPADVHNLSLCSRLLGAVCQPIIYGHLPIFTTTKRLSQLTAILQLFELNSDAQMWTKSLEFHTPPPGHSWSHASAREFDRIVIRLISVLRDLRHLSVALPKFNSVLFEHLLQKETLETLSWDQPRTSHQLTGSISVRGLGLKAVEITEGHWPFHDSFITDLVVQSNRTFHELEIAGGEYPGYACQSIASGLQTPFYKLADLSLQTNVAGPLDLILDFLGMCPHLEILSLTGAFTVPEASHSLLYRPNIIPQLSKFSESLEFCPFIIPGRPIRTLVVTGHERLKIPLPITSLTLRSILGVTPSLHNLVISYAFWNLNFLSLVADVLPELLSLSITFSRHLEELEMGVWLDLLFAPSLKGFRGLKILHISYDAPRQYLATLGPDLERPFLQSLTGVDALREVSFVFPYRVWKRPNDGEWAVHHALIPSGFAIEL